MVFFKILGQPFLVLASVQGTYDLFEKRSSNYSDRPRLPMLNEVSVTFPLSMSGMLTGRQDGLYMEHGPTTIRAAMEEPSPYLP